MNVSKKNADKSLKGILRRILDDNEGEVLEALTASTRIENGETIRTLQTEKFSIVRSWLAAKKFGVDEDIVTGNAVVSVKKSLSALWSGKSQSPLDRLVELQNRVATTHRGTSDIPAGLMYELEMSTSAVGEFEELAALLRAKRPIPSSSLRLWKPDLLQRSLWA